MYKINNPNHFTITKAPNGVIYYYAYNKDGKRIKKSTGCRTKGKALDVISMRIKEGTLVDDISSKSVKMLFKDYCEPFFRWNSCPIVKDKLARGGHYSIALCESNRKSLEKHILPTFGNKYLINITYSMINSWILGLPKKNNIANTTCNKMLSILKQILDYAVLEGYLESSPAKLVKPLIANDKRRGCFSVNEVQRIFSLKWASSLAYAACFVSAFTGLRLGEIRALRMSHVHEDYILVDSSYSDEEGLKCTKNGKARIVPITLKIFNILKHITNNNHSEYIFSFGEKNTPCSDRVITLPLYEMLERVGIDREERNLTFHSFRHFFNTQVVANGISSEIVRSVIGHSSIEMTEHYLHLSATDMDSIKQVQKNILKDVRRKSFDDF